MRAPSLTFRLAALLVLQLGSAAAWVAPAHAEWQDIATISTTIGNTPYRLCMGAGGSNIGCPADAPLLDPTTHRLTVPGDLRVVGNLLVSGSQSFDGVTFANGGVSATGTISATGFSGDGSGITGIDFSANPIDRIVSGTAAVIAQQAGTVGLTLGGTPNAAYFHPTLGFVGPGVSTTGPISGTDGYFSGGVGIGGTVPAWLGPNALYMEGKIRADSVYVGNGMAWANGTVENRIDSGSLEYDDSYINFTFNYVEAMRVVSGGYVGIGTKEPSTSLHVNGTMRVASGGENCDADRRGAIKYEGNQFLVCRNGSSWETMIAGANGNVDTDRITSGTTAVVVNSATGIISFTTAGTNTAYMHGTLGLITPGVSATGTVSSGNVNTGLVVLRGIAGGAGISLTAPGDNLGNHTATQDLDMAGNNIINANIISATSFTGDGSGLTNINAANITGLTADRITSGTTQVLTQQDGSVTISMGGKPRMIIGNSNNIIIGDATGITNLPPINRGLNIIGDGNYMDDIQIVAYSNSIAGDAGLISGVRFRGTKETPLGVLAGDRLLEIRGSAGDGTSFALAGNMEFQAETDWIAGNTSTRNANIIFNTRSANVVAEKMRITANGNVGIGLATPTTKLNVSGTLRIASGAEACDADRTGAIKYESGQFQICRNGTSWETLVAGSSGTVNTDRITSGTTSVLTTNNTSVTIATAGVERMVIGTNGNIGIGIQPGSASALTVSGSTVFTNTSGALTLMDNNDISSTVGVTGYVRFTDSGGNLYGLIGDNSASDNAMGLKDLRPGSYLSFAASNTEIVRMLGNGNVGIGLTAPTTALEVSGTVSSTNAYTGLLTLRAVTGSAGVSLTNAGDNLGNHTATQNLDMAGFSIVNAGNLTTDRITSGTTGMYTYNNTSATIATAGVERMVIGTTGNVGIGTSSPNVRLHLRGSAWKESALMLEQTATDGRAYSLSSRPDGKFMIGDEVSGSIRLALDKNGNVGIGVSSPTSIFQIRNNIIFDEGNGATTSGPDIRMTSAGLIATDDSLHINIDATNTGGGGFYINKGSMAATASATTLLALSNGGNLTLGYADTVTDTRLLTVKSAGYAGLVLNGDTTNVSGEPGGAYVAFGLDGNRPNGQHYIGMTNRNGESPKGVSTTGATVNSLMLGTEYTDANGNIQFAPGNVVNMTMLATNGNIGIATISPTTKLEVSGTISGTTLFTPLLKLEGISSSAGISMTSGGGDNLGNHTATQNLDMAGFSIVNAGNLSTDRIISGTTSVAATSSGLINLTTNGTLTGYFDTIGRLIAPGISLTTPHGISSTNGYFANNVTIGYDDAITDTRLLTVKSAGYAGLLLNGDTTNVSGEPGGAYVAFKLDGYNPSGTHYIGMTNRTGEDPRGISVTGAIGNSLMMGTNARTVNGNIQFASGDAVNMTILGANGNVGIGLTAPTTALEVSGTISGTTLFTPLLTLQGVSSSAGVSITSGGSDNLGNHTATQSLNMSGNSIVSASNIAAAGSIQAGDADTVCSTTTDYGKMRFNPATKKMFMCRP